MPSPARTVTCIYCGNQVRSDSGCYPRHSQSPKQRDDMCPLSYQRVPRVGLTERDWEHRAKQVANLAWQLHDCDPAIVWAYLTALPADELQRLTLVALAGIPIEGRTVDDIFDWVTELPTAQRISA